MHNASQYQRRSTLHNMYRICSIRLKRNKTEEKKLVLPDSCKIIDFLALDREPNYIKHPKPDKNNWTYLRGGYAQKLMIR
jgi:hypothetical protein